MPEAGDTGKIRKFITLKYRDKKWYALTPNTVELIPTLGALPPPRRARPGPGPHTADTLPFKIDPTHKWSFVCYLNVHVHPMFGY